MEENKALVRQWVEEMDKQNWTIYDELNAPDAVLHSGGITFSREEARQMAPAYYKAFPDFHHVIDDLIAEGDKVVLRTTDYGTHEGEFMGVPPTGKKVSFGMIAIYRIKDGKIIEAWGVYDMLGLMNQLGAQK
ncbi:ester cyclase [candidate division KSB1 bacterium]